MIPDDHMVEALAADGADHPLHIRIAQSSQLHMIRSIYIRFASPTPFIGCAASVFRS
jgi:hypothetical protein